MTDIKLILSVGLFSLTVGCVTAQGPSSPAKNTTPSSPRLPASNLESSSSLFEQPEILDDLKKRNFSRCTVVIEMSYQGGLSYRCDDGEPGTFFLIYSPDKKQADKSQPPATVEEFNQVIPKVIHQSLGFFAQLGLHSQGCFAASPSFNRYICYVAR